MTVDETETPIRRPRRVATAVSRDLGEGETVVLVDQERAVVLNALGTAVWHLASGDRTIDQIVAVIAEAFPQIAPAKLRADVVALLGKLAAQELIEPA